jgi:hypothetical protein
MAILLNDEEWEDRERFGGGFIRRKHPQVVLKVPLYFLNVHLPSVLLYGIDAHMVAMAAHEWVSSSEAQGFVHIREEPLMEVLPDFAFVTFPPEGGMVEEPTKIGDIYTYTFTDPATAFMFRMKFS